MPTNNTNQRQYGNGSNSDIGASQMNTYLYDRKALIEALRENYFGQLADSVSMPKHFGKTIKKYQYIPLLHDANTNDQGIDASGVSTSKNVTVKITMSDGSIPPLADTVYQTIGRTTYVTGNGNDEATAIANVIAKVNDLFEQASNAGGIGLTLVGANDVAKFANLVNSTDGQGYAKGFRFTTEQGAALETSTPLTGTAVPAYGNLYGSSRAVGTITGKLPLLGETGGFVNRVGFKRVELQGSINKYGIYDEYTKESYDFDSDAQLEMHVRRELVRGAHYINEDLLQLDLLNQAGIVRFGGIATSNSEITAEGANPSIPVYEDFLRLNIDLDNNRCPRDTKMLTGSDLVDTRTVNGGRVMYVGSEVVPMLKTMKDSFNNQAFISVEKYGAATQVLKGEIGAIDQFRIVLVPSMMFWEGKGAAVGTNTGYRETNGNYDVFPMLVVGSGSFSTIGFQASGQNMKFKIKHSKPESPESYARDPYGETGFTSIKFWYGSIVDRPEWIALFKTVAKW